MISKEYNTNIVPQNIKLEKDGNKNLSFSADLHSEKNDEKLISVYGKIKIVDDGNIKADYIEVNKTNN